MDAISVDLPGDIDIIIDDKGNMVLAAQCLDRFCFLQERSLIQLLLAQLHEGRAAFDGCFDLLIQGLPSEPVAVRHRIQQQIFFIALHSVRPLPAYRHPC